ncbi:MAG: hypothetical protein BWY79_00992 [Actinobacteria bacterium ADurb.Bin444]|nr:MAG: hypothetical protein BWY79_00992 [Actinobacteria bacterium ADurb.Bin444]
MASTEASATRCFSPPERRCKRRPSKPSSPTSANASLMRGPIASAGTHRFSRPKATSSSTLSVQNCDSGSWNTSPTSVESTYAGVSAATIPATTTFPW